MEVYGRLKAAFLEYRQQLAAPQSTAAVQRAIIFYAGWLGHYVADGSQPLHTTIQYNGLVEQVYSLEKAGSFIGKGTPAGFEFTTQRLAAGSQMLLDLWYTAWLDSAIPAPDHVSPGPATK